MDRQHMRFTENRGQVADMDGQPRPDILYTADAGGARLYFTKYGMRVIFLRGEDPEQSVSEATGMQDPPDGIDETASTLRFHSVTMAFLDCNPAAVVTCRHELPGVDNYYLPHCPDGITGVRSYRQLRYGGLYAGIDLVFHAAEPGAVKYDFVVAPQGDPSTIRMRFDGADAVTIDREGSLHVVSGFGEQVHRTPYAYTEDGRPVDCSYTVDGCDVSITCGAYDRAKSLVIDPWSTFYGGSGRDLVYSTRCDASGNVIAAGSTESTNLPTSSGSAQRSLAGGKDLFVVKFDGSGNHLWSTYYGGSANDEASLEGAVDGSGNVIMGVRTASVDFPVSAGAYQAINGGGLSDAALVKLDANGGRVWATYLGGSGDDACYGSGVAAAADGNGDIVLCGTTQSADFPVSAGAFQTTLCGSSDPYIAKFSSSGGLLWATYYGGSSNDAAYSCATDGSGNIVVAGTAAGNFPVTQSPPAGASDGFILKLDGSGARLWARCFGGSNGDNLWGVATDNAGNIAAAGTTYSSDLPVTPGAPQTTRPGEQDWFAAKFDAGGAVVWATYCGGSQNDYCWALAMTGSGNVIVGGGTSSNDFPVSSGCFQPVATGNGDGFILVIDGSGALQWASYLGGNDWDDVQAVAADANGNVVCGGRARSMNFPTVTPYQLSYGGGIEDGFVAKFDAGGSLPAEWSSLTAERVGWSVALRWHTESETGNLGFEVQRSLTAREGDWERRGFVAGAGTNTVAHEYSFLDEAPPGSYPDRSIYYRLRQVDVDGTARYSPVVEAFPVAARRGFAILSLAPQPAGNETVLRFTLDEDDVVAFALHDGLGRSVATLRSGALYRAGTHAVPLHLAGIAAGTYILRAAGSRASAAAKVLVR